MKKCLIAINGSDILTAGVKHLLSTTPGLVILSQPIEDRSRLVEAIYRNQVDVVITEGDRLIDKDLLASLWLSQPDLLIIQIDTSDNRLHIYQHQHVYIRQPSELIQLIQSHNSVNRSEEENYTDVRLPPHRLNP
jgi:hypothetical protein